MQTQAKLRHLRMSPRKVRLVVDLIRGLEVEPALNQLKFMQNKAAHPLTKLLNSALANAEHNHELKKDNLYIKEIRVDEGPSLKRWRPRAFGRASGIQKRTSHISLILSEIKASPKKEDKPADKKLAKAKVVKSLDEIKEKEVDQAPVDQSAKSDTTTDQAAHTPDPVDVTRMGKDREKQHLDKVRQKEKGGALKRMFRRKSI